MGLIDSVFDAAGTGTSVGLNIGTGKTITLAGTTKFSGSTSGTTTVQATAVAGTTVLTLPAATDTLVGKATTDTLTNKSIAATQLTGTIAAARLPAGSVLQVLSTTKTDTTSFTSTSTNSYVDITGMSVTITPTSATSKILVMYSIGVSQSTDATIHIRLLRDSTSIDQGVAASNRLGDSTIWRPNSSQYNFDIGPLSNSFLDSPSTTSATTYKLAATLGASYSGTFYLNRSWSDADADFAGRVASTITVMEIAA
jgi:hypothetical protein